MTDMDHTSGGQRAAEVEATAEQLAEWERRLRARADELGREAHNLAMAAGSHGTEEGERVAGYARAAVLSLAAAAGPRHAGTTPPSDQREEGVTHTLDRDEQWGHSDTHGAVLLGATETRSLITPDQGAVPPFAADLVAERPPHER